MNRFLLALLAWLAPLAARAHWWELKVSDLRSADRGEQCLILLSHLSGRLDPLSDFKIAVHSPQDIAELLRHSGATSAEVKEVERILNGIRNDPPDHEALRTTLRRLKNPGTDDRLFVCVLGKDCELPGGTDAIFDPVLMNFEMAKGIDGNMVKNGVRATQSTAGLKREMNAILLRYPRQYPEEFRATIFAVNLYHETQHFMDMDLISAWISANREILKSGGQPDALFKRFVRIVKPDKEGETLVLDHGFFTAFSESRGYSVSSAIYRRFLKPDRFKVIDRELRAHGFQDAIEDGARKILVEEKITEDNFYDLGDRWAGRMRETIRRAGGS